MYHDPLEAPLICIPPKYLPELQKLGDDVLSFSKSTAEFLQSRYTGVVTEAPLMIHMIKADLTPALRRLNPELHAEVTHAMREYFGECSEWTELNATNQLLQVVAQVSGRAFVGEELCRDPKYISTAINYTVDLMTAVRAVTLVPEWKRWWAAPRLPEVKRLRQYESDGIEMLRSVIDSRLNAAAADPEYTKPDDIMQWTLDRLLEQDGKVNAALAAKYQLILTFAAIHTTTLTATNA